VSRANAASQFLLGLAWCCYTKASCCYSCTSIVQGGSFGGIVPIIAKEFDLRTLHSSHWTLAGVSTSLLFYCLRIDRLMRSKHKQLPKDSVIIEFTSGLWTGRVAIRRACIASFGDVRFHFLAEDGGDLADLGSYYGTIPYHSIPYINIIIQPSFRTRHVHVPRASLNLQLLDYIT
jgi:hypothetical protein